MWIRSEEDLRRHLEDPTSREGHAFEYKGAIDTNPNKGRGADFASSVGSLANADGGQVLLGVRDKDGAPDKVVGVKKLDEVGKDIEDSISNFLVGIEPRPKWKPFEYDAHSTVIVVDVLPSVRLVAYWNTGERDKIMYPVRTGDRLSYMRPGDVEARILTYGPRAQRILIEQLLERASEKKLGLFHFHHSSGSNVANAVRVHTAGDADVYASRLDDFGLELTVSGWTGQTQGTVGRVWIPYDWIVPYLAGAAQKSRVVLRISGFISVAGSEVTLTPLPPSFL